MIYTVTFNPSLDYTVSVNGFSAGKTNRTYSERLFPGGKGINVSIVLHNLGIETTALGFIAGFTGEQIEREVQNMGLFTDFIHIKEGFSRINVKIKNCEGTEINGIGPVIRQAAIEKLYGKLDKLQAGDILVLAGSVPAGLPSSIYGNILQRLQKKGILFVVDAAKDLLLPTLPYRPFLVKPNLQELQELFCVTLKTKREAAIYAGKLREKGAQNVLASMGGQGAVLADATGRMHFLNAPKGMAVNAVGAGDSMVAGFLAGWTGAKDYAHAFRMGVSTGSASAFSERLATKEEAERLLAVCPSIESTL